MRVHLGREKVVKQVTPFLLVGNNRYQTSGLRLGTRSQLDAGRLWVCTARSAGRENILGVALKTLMGRGTEQGLNIFEAEELSADPGSTRVNVSTDGEVSIMDAPLQLPDSSPRTRHCHPREYSLSFGWWRANRKSAVRLKPALSSSLVRRFEPNLSQFERRSALRPPTPAGYRAAPADNATKK